jgi:hypothetical protein
VIGSLLLLVYGQKADKNEVFTEFVRWRIQFNFHERSSPLRMKMPIR